MGGKQGKKKSTIDISRVVCLWCKDFGSGFYNPLFITKHPISGKKIIICYNCFSEIDFSG